MLDNSIATFPEETYDEFVLPSRVLALRSVVINDPDGVKHVLLDSAANYAKPSLTRKLLEPFVGKGIVTSEGALWRRQRRIMSPAFDHRSILSHTPVVTEEAEETARRWGMSGSGETDIGTEIPARGPLRPTDDVIRHFSSSAEKATDFSVSRRAVCAAEARCLGGPAQGLTDENPLAPPRPLGRNIGVC